MKRFLLLLICICVFQTFVESGIIFDNLKDGVANTRQTIRCGIHKIDGLMINRKVECDDNENNQQNEIKHQEDNKQKGSKQEDAIKLKVQNTTESVEVVTVPEGKRVINVGANCPEGFRDDGKGNCKEEY